MSRAGESTGDAVVIEAHGKAGLEFATVVPTATLGCRGNRLKAALSQRWRGGWRASRLDRGKDVTALSVASPLDGIDRQV